MKGTDLYRKMSLIDDELIEKNSAPKFKRSHKPLWLTLIAAALALSILAAFAIPALTDTDTGGDDWVPPVFTDEREPRPQPEYVSNSGEKLKYLTAQTFSSNREKGEVSEEFRQVAAHFAFELLKNSNGNYEGDGLLISPLSAMIALAMTANGAEGETLEEIEKVIAGGMYIDRLNQELFNFTSPLSSFDEAKLNFSNSIWVTSNPKYKINKNFVKTIENTFDADIISADMKDPATVDAVNAWARERTDGMIDSIISPNNMPRNTVIMLINSLAFDAIWKDQVKDEDCFKDQFNGKDGITFMETACDSYIKGENEVGIVKSYYAAFSFVALLPNEGIDINTYIDSLDGDTFLALYDSKESSTNRVEVNVTAKMPHFSYDCSVDFEKILKKMGIKKAFGLGADFGALFENNVYISRVLQKTHIDLNNAGTRAAAVTVIMGGNGGYYHPPVITKNYYVSLNRPFVYGIIDTATGLPIFLGVCENIN